MIRSRILLSILGGILLISTPVVAADEEPNADLPKFTAGEAQKAFDEGHGLFQKGEWKAAEKLFKECSKKGEGEDRDRIKPWIQACKGGARLNRIDKVINKQEWRKAWVEIQRVNASYKETPLQATLAEYLERIEGNLFFPLATFEEDPPESQVDSSRHPSTAQINTDPRFVAGGKRSIQWTEKVGLGSAKILGWLPLAEFPGSLIDDHRYLSVSIYKPGESFGKYTLYFYTDEDPAQGGFANPLAVLKARCHYKHLTVEKQGWNHYRVDLWKELSNHSGAQRSEIRGLHMLIIPPSKADTVYIDEVKLERSK